MAADLRGVVSDSACLIGLERIGQLEILPKLYGEVIIPNAVQSEIRFKVPWLQVQVVQNQSLVESLRGQIGWGESEAIALTLELESSILILDDRKARKIAERLNLVITGTIGMLLKAKQAQIIDEVRPILDALEIMDFRIAPALRQQALILAGE